MNDYKITFDMTISRFNMLKIGLSCIWHSMLGTGYIHFKDVGCDALVKKIKGMNNE